MSTFVERGPDKPAPGAPIHRHLDADETLYILDGSFESAINITGVPAPVPPAGQRSRRGWDNVS